MRSLEAESATAPAGFWPGAQKKCFGFVRSLVRDDAVDAPSITARTTSTASAPARRAKDRAEFMVPPMGEVDSCPKWMTETGRLHTWIPQWTEASGRRPTSWILDPSLCGILWRTPRTGE